MHEWLKTLEIENSFVTKAMQEAALIGVFGVDCIIQGIIQGIIVVKHLGHRQVIS